MIVTGLATVLAGPGGRSEIDPLPFLRVRKSRKYMGVQDELAVTATGRALADADLPASSPGDRTGLFLVVGYIPFEWEDVEPLARASTEDGRFSMRAFTTVGDTAVSPLLTFRCLPNMPAYHITANFGITGPYFVTYPGPGQAALALEAAVRALHRREVDVALVGGVAHQRNFLVVRHHLRIRPPVPEERLLDAAGVLVLEREEDARGRGAPERARLLDQTISYEPHDPFLDPPRFGEAFTREGRPLVLPGETGAASLFAALARAREEGRGEFRQVLRSRDGFVVESAWGLP